MGETKNIVFGDPSTAKILVGAHYDSVDTPGSDDNGSALAVMLKVASYNAGKGICYVAFNGEECGLIGAKEFVNSFPMPKLEEAHILEMVGYCDHKPNSQENPFGALHSDFPTTGNFIGVVSNSEVLSDNALEDSEDILPLLSMFISKQILQSKLPANMQHIFRSDHYPFWMNGYNAAMWTDTAEFRNKKYHTQNDTPDTLDYEFMTNVSKVLTNAVQRSLRS